MLADLAHPTDGTHAALEPAVVLGAVKRALLERRAAVDGREAGRADLKLGELVKLDLDRVVRVALALGLCFAGLFRDGRLVPGGEGEGYGGRRVLTVSKILLPPPFAIMRFAKLSAEL
jgi:hypothetical protein